MLVCSLRPSTLGWATLSSTIWCSGDKGQIRAVSYWAVAGSCPQLTTLSSSKSQPSPLATCTTKRPDPMGGSSMRRGRRHVRLMPWLCTPLPAQRQRKSIGTRCEAGSRVGGGGPWPLERLLRLRLCRWCRLCARGDAASLVGVGGDDGSACVGVGGAGGAGTFAGKVGLSRKATLSAGMALAAALRAPRRCSCDVDVIVVVVGDDDDDDMVVVAVAEAEVTALAGGGRGGVVTASTKESKEPPVSGVRSSFRPLGDRAMGLRVTMSGTTRCAPSSLPTASFIACVSRRS